VAAAHCRDRLVGDHFASRWVEPLAGVRAGRQGDGELTRGGLVCQVLGAGLGVPSRNGQNRTLGVCEGAQEPWSAPLRVSALPPSVISGQANVSPPQRRQVLKWRVWRARLGALGVLTGRLVGEHLVHLGIPQLSFLTLVKAGDTNMAEALPQQVDSSRGGVRPSANEPYPDAHTARHPTSG